MAGNYTLETEIELIELARQGDEKAWNQLLGDPMHSSSLSYRLMKRVEYLLDGLMHEVGDVYGDAIIDIYGQIHNFQGKARFSTYCTVILNTKIRKFYWDRGKRIGEKISKNIDYRSLLRSNLYFDTAVLTIQIEKKLELNKEILDSTPNYIEIKKKLELAKEILDSTLNYIELKYSFDAVDGFKVFNRFSEVKSILSDSGIRADAEIMKALSKWIEHIEYRLPWHQGLDTFGGVLDPEPESSEVNTKSIFDDIAGKDPLPEDELFRTQQYQIYKSMLSQLSEQDRQILEMRFLDEKKVTLQEMADTLGLNDHNVARRREQRALQRSRELLLKSGY
jgi:RNA polymerase sigma factor (sigma-70 family)